MTSHRMLDFVSSVANEVSNVANEVANRWPDAFSFPPANQPAGQRNLDVTYINERLLATSKPAEAPVPTRNDVGRDEHPWKLTKDQARSSLTPQGNDALPEQNMPQDASAQRSRQVPQHDEVRQPQHMSSRRKAGVNPGTLSTFLTRRHGTHFLAINLSEEDPDDRTLLLLNRQILKCHWSSPCIHKSETPCLSHILDICYVMHAFLSLHDQNVICVYCANGRTRTAIVIACYLKFSRRVSTSFEGFRIFLSKRCPHLDPNATLNNIPPSLVTFFRNFDDCVELGTVLNPKPLLLRAIAVQGVPTDDKPCIDIWDSRQQHVYSSHDDETLSQWADEEGFYRVNQVLEGDFVLLCRFGGPYTDETDDPSKVLFRYANTTGFLASGPYELPKSKVDMMRRYVQSFDEEDFSLTLLMESYWDCTDEDQRQRLERNCDSKVMPPVLEGRDAMEKGWHLISERHAAHPELQDAQVLMRSFPELQECPSHLCTLALQLTNFDFEAARLLLFAGSMKSWWRKESGSECLTEPEEANKSSKDDNVSPLPDQGCLDILRILDEVDGESTLSAPQHDDSHDEDVAMAPRQAQQEVPQLLYEPILFPNRGDIVDSFGDYYKQIHARNGRQRRDRHRRPLTLGSKPRMPLVPRKRIRSQESEESQKRPHVDPFNQIGGFPNPRGANGDLVYDEDFMAAMEIFLQIRHTGVTLEDLRRLQASSREWTGIHPFPSEQPVSEESGHTVRQSGETGSRYTKGTVPAASEERDATASVPPKEGDHGAYGPSTGVTEEKNDSSKQVSTVSGKNEERGADVLNGNMMGLKFDSSSKTEGEVPLKVTTEGDVPLEDDPEYDKYFRMLKMQLPMEAVKHAMKRDGKDPATMDLDPKKTLKSQQQEQRQSESGLSDGLALKDEPEYQKYYKMKAMGLPLDAVKHAMQRDGKDPTIMDLDPDKSLKSQHEHGQSTDDDGPPLKDDPEYAKYWKMLKMGLPAGAVKNAILRDGKDPSIIDLDPEKSLKSQIDGPNEEKDDGPPLCEDPEFAKYFRMMKLGLPVGAAKNAMLRDGKDPSIMDLDPNKSLESQTKNEVIDTGVAIKDDPEYSKYFKMLSMGLPMGAVKNALLRDGKDPSIMDLDPDKSVAFQLRQKSGRAMHRKKEKKRVRRKKIYWTPIDPGKVNEDSIWSMVRGSVVMDKLKYDPKEFENLFTESTNPADKKKAAASSGDKSKQQKKSVQVIDGKRSMNGGIILSRIKMEYTQIAAMVDVMDSGKFDSTQLSALKEFLPTDDERKALQEYLKKGGTSQQAFADAMADLSECEKYMAAMMKIENAASKFDCMIFRVQFNGRIQELVDGIDIITKACDEVRSSERLRKMMAMILTLVNQINTGGDGNVALGFSLDALLKLNEAKAFDKKTSVLQYLVKLVKQNDESLMDFKDDIESVPAAEGVILDGLQNDASVLLDEVKQVHETAKNEADRLEKEGKTTKMSIAEIKEQKTEVRHISGLPHYNKMDHITGRTPMERFAARATAIVEGIVAALEKLKKTYDGVLAYFGEDEKMASNAFFGTMKKFVLEFQSSAEQVEKEEKAKLKEKLRAAAKKVVGANRVASIAVSPIKDRMKAPSLADLQSAKQSMGDIAVLAAQRVKDFKLAGKDDSKSTSHSSAGGIAALAAAAALKKRHLAGKGQEGNETSAGSDMDGSPPPFLGGGGIAAAAAAAARNRYKVPKEEVDKGEAGRKEPLGSGRAPFLGGGGIAAAAAAAARNRSKVPKDEVDKGKAGTWEPVDSVRAPFLGVVGIAAAAAAAARNRNKASKEEVDEDGDDGFEPSCDASGAAVLHSMKSDTTDETSDAVSGRHPFPGGGGMAAAAALAARYHVKVSEGESVNDDDDRTEPASDPSGATAGNSTKLDAMDASDMGRDPPPFLGGGGIAAAAAAAARNRNKVRKEEATKDGAGTREPASSGPPLFLAGGGIAAAADAAARHRNTVSKEEVDKDGADKREPVGSGRAPFLGGVGIAAAAAAAARNRNKASKEEVDEDGDDGMEPACGASTAAVLDSTKSGTTDETLDAVSGRHPFPGGGGIAAAAALVARYRVKVSEEESVDDDDDDDDDDRTEPASDASGATACISTNLDAANTSDVSDDRPPFLGGITAAAAARNRNMALKELAETEADEMSCPLSGSNPGGIAGALRLVEESMKAHSTDCAHPLFWGGDGTTGAARSNSFYNEVFETEVEVAMKEFVCEETCDVATEADGGEVNTMPPLDRELGDWLSLDMLLADGNTLPLGSELGESVDVSAGIREPDGKNAMRESVDEVRGKNHQLPGEDFASCRSSRNASPEALSCLAETGSWPESLILPRANLSGHVHLENNEKATVRVMKDRVMVDSDDDDTFYAASGGLAEPAADKKLLGAKDGSPNAPISDTSHYSTGDEDQGSKDVPSPDVKANGDDESPDVPPSPSGSTSGNEESKSNAKAYSPPIAPSKGKVNRWLWRANDDNAEPPAVDQSIASGASNDSAARDGHQASESHDGSHVESPLQRFIKRSKGERDVTASQENNVKTASLTNESTPKSSPKSSSDQKRPKKQTGFQSWLAQLNTEQGK